MEGRGGVGIWEDFGVVEIKLCLGEEGDEVVVFIRVEMFDNYSIGKLWWKGIWMFGKWSLRY